MCPAVESIAGLHSAQAWHAALAVSEPAAVLKLWIIMSTPSKF